MRNLYIPAPLETWYPRRHTHTIKNPISHGVYSFGQHSADVVQLTANNSEIKSMFVCVYIINVVINTIIYPYQHSCGFSRLITQLTRYIKADKSNSNLNECGLLTCSHGVDNIP